MALGISDATWDELRVHRYVGHDLDETTQLYVDVHIAVELFRMRYPEYISRTTPAERQLYQLYLALKAKKDEHIQWHHEHDGKAEEFARDVIDPRGRGA